MGFLDALLHLLNFLMPALGTGVIAATLAKLLWRRELAAVAWRRLVQWACLANLGVLVVGLIVAGRDGRMATYGAIGLATALALWAVGFGPARRRG